MRTKTIDLEVAVDLINEMIEVNRHEEAGVSLVHGTHPEKGNLVLVLPCIGNGILYSPIELLE